MMESPPIDPHTQLRNRKVVHIAELKAQQGVTRRQEASCKHLNLVYDKRERRVWCSDCEHEIDAFDAFQVTCENMHKAVETLKSREARIKDAFKEKVRHSAAKSLEEAWSNEGVLPVCPHCREGLAPEDFRKVHLADKRFFKR